MSRRASTRFSLGPVSFATPKAKRAAKPRRAPVALERAPVALEHGGYPDARTYGVALSLDPAHVRTLAARAVSQANGRERAAVALLAADVARYATQIALALPMPAMTKLLVVAGLDCIDWDAIARQALSA